MVHAGFSRRSGPVGIEVVYPFSPLTPFSTKNDHSQVIRVTAGPWSVLFTGDIEENAEKELAGRYGNALRCDILKVPHHGSASSSTAGFLSRCSPGAAVFPLGYNNSFGFPHPTVLARYRSLGCRLFFTSELGGILAQLRPGKISWKVSRFPAEHNVIF